METTDLGEQLRRIADALEASLVAPDPQLDFAAAHAFVWHPRDGFLPVPAVNRVDLRLLEGINHQISLLMDNTRRFANGLPANNALLWGSRGMGKSSLVKAAHAEVMQEKGQEKVAGTGASLKLVEIHREDIDTLPACLSHIRGSADQFILFCDDLSFDHDDTSYKSLKAVLDGGIEGRPANVIFYATSNRRHLMPREMVDNERSTAINPSEAIEEKVSLSDRFGLWLGFHKCSQDDYLAMVTGYVDHYGIAVDAEKLRAEALEWSTTRGSRSGRVAWQFIQDLAGRHGVRLS